MSVYVTLNNNLCVGISENREFEEAWGQATGAHRQRSLTELTDAITQIDDPKLQRSNFMQFMHKINKGQVSFADNKVSWLVVGMPQILVVFCREKS